jgi:hypothetical protein
MRVASRKLPQVAFTALAVTALVQAADFTRPDIKPGLWEVTNSPQISGEMPIPEDQLAKLTPEQRSRLQAAMQANLAKGNKPRVYKECMTPEKIARGFEIGPQADDSSCKRNVISSTAKELTLHDECSKADRKTVTDVHFEVKGGTQMSGKIHVVMNSGGRTMTVNSTLQGKWLSANCGTVKDAQLEK